MEKAAGLLQSLYDSGSGHISLLVKTGRKTYYRKTTELAAAMVGSSVIILLGGCCLVFLGVAFAFWLSELTGSLKLAFLLTAVFYAALLGIYMILHRPIQSSVRNFILRRISDERITDFDALANEEKLLKQEVQISEERLKQDFGALKAEIRRSYGPPGAEPVAEESAEGKESLFSRQTVGTAVDFLLRNVVLRRAGPIKRLVLPIVTNALMQPGKNKLLQKIGARLSRFL
jgi:hypothetical protein